MVRYAWSGQIPVTGALRGQVPAPNHFEFWYIAVCWEYTRDFSKHRNFKKSEILQGN